MISDIDGTITKSDLLGHLLPRVGFDWSHRGVTRLFTNIKANGYVFMFLSSRAIAQASATRDYLHTLNQDGETLPAGPVIISPDGLFPSLYRELVSPLTSSSFLTERAGEWGFIPGVSLSPLRRWVCQSVTLS